MGEATEKTKRSNPNKGKKRPAFMVIKVTEGVPPLKADDIVAVSRSAEKLFDYAQKDGFKIVKLPDLE